ncbi:carbohydrate ABC transporter permease [Phycicoccus avicenniae]|nr:carbohydrate ABC transporter permease [Phycicoccus avicenniae]
MVFPFVWQLVMSLSTNSQVTSIPPTFWPGELQWANFGRVFESIPFLDQFWVSVSITVLRTAGQLLLCSLAGYAFARMRFPFRRVIFGLTLSILMVPPEVFMIPQYQIIQNLGLLNTTTGVVLPGIFSAFGAFFMTQFFRGIPVELEEAARLDGCNPWQIFIKVMLPLVKPGLSALAVLTVVWSWNDLLWPLVVTTDTTKMPLTVGLASLQGQYTTDYAVLMAASTMAVAPILILFIIMQRRVIDGIASSGLKG